MIAPSLSPPGLTGRPTRWAETCPCPVGAPAEPGHDKRAGAVSMIRVIRDGRRRVRGGGAALPVEAVAGPRAGRDPGRAGAGGGGAGTAGARPGLRGRDVRPGDGGAGAAEAGGRWGGLGHRRAAGDGGAAAARGGAGGPRGAAVRGRELRVGAVRDGAELALGRAEGAGAGGGGAGAGAAAGRGGAGGGGDDGVRGRGVGAEGAAAAGAGGGGGAVRAVDERAQRSLSTAR